MRRSANVFAPLLASTALALATGCHKQQPEMQRCVDEQNHVVDPKFCANLPPGQQQSAAGSPGNGGGYYGGNGMFFPHFYRNYYGGLGGYALGSLVSGGTYVPRSGHSYASPSRGASSSGTSRGGFGGSFSSSGGHGGGSGA